MEEMTVREGLSAKKYTMDEWHEKKVTDIKKTIDKIQRNIDAYQSEKTFLMEAVDRLDTPEGKRLLIEDFRINRLENKAYALKTFSSIPRVLKPIYQPQSERKDEAWISGYGMGWDSKRAKILRERFAEHKGEYCQIGNKTVRLDDIAIKETESGYSEVWVKGLALETRNMKHTGFIPYITTNTRLPMGRMIECVDPEVAIMIERKAKAYF